MRFSALAALAAVGTPHMRQHAPPAARTEFVVTAGSDTIATERITRDGSQVKADLLVKAQGARITFTMQLGPDGTVSRLLTEARAANAPESAAPLQRATVDFTKDSALLTIGDAAEPSQRFAAPAGTLPFINLSSAIVEQIFRRAKALGGESVDVPVFAVAGGQLLQARVEWASADSATLALGGATIHARVSPEGEFLGGTVPTQGVSFTRVDAGSGASAPAPTPAAAPVPKPDYSAPPEAPYTAEEVSVPAPKAGIELAGTLTIPMHASATRVPAVVMITGSGPEDRDEATPVLPGYRPFREIADTLGRHGIAVLRMDDRGVGGTPRGPSDPTSADFADDIRAALAYLRERPEIDATRLGLIGHSEGALIALMVGASDPELHAVVLVAGSSRTGRQISDAQIRTAFEHKMHLSGAALDSAIRANEPAREAQLASSAWLRFWFDFDPRPTAKKLHMPVLIVQGATDTQVTPDQAEELASAVRSGGNADVTVRVIPETNHLLVHDPDGSFTNYSKLKSFDVNSPVLAAIADWLGSRMH
ncbi:MAG TPA: alpha/beta fold hydrolase [Gemmatimonadaceae bacterium]|nr:alpha/beta fold hydrolase [Gemmatimonadaceae bacterium]